MNSLSGVNVIQNVDSQVTVPESLINKMLPNAIFHLVLVRLNNIDLQSTACVSRFWNRSAIFAVKHREYALIVNFAKLLANTLPSEGYPYQREILFNIENNRELMLASSLIQVKTSILKMKEEILNISKTIFTKYLTEIKLFMSGSTKPRFLDELFLFERSELAHFSYELADNGRLDKAIEIARMTPDEGGSIHPFSQISYKLLKQGKVDKSLELAKEIPNDSIKCSSFITIFLFFMDLDAIERAEEVADLYPDDHYRSMCYQKIFERLMAIGNMDHALIIAKKIPLSDKFNRSFCFSECSRHFTEEGNIEKALEVAEMSESYRNNIIANICSFLTENDDFQKAQEVIHMIKDDETKIFVLLIFANRLIRSGDIDKAKVVANMIPDEEKTRESRNLVFKAIENKKTFL